MAQTITFIKCSWNIIYNKQYMLGIERYTFEYRFPGYRNITVAPINSTVHSTVSSAESVTNHVRT